MANSNKFPDSLEKQFLRDVQLNNLAKYKAQVGHNLNYFGLPSADMLDVKLWKHVLGEIVAVEQDVELVIPMTRTATAIGVINRTPIIERPLLDTVKLLALDEQMAQLSLTSYSTAEQNKFRKARSFGYDIINFDPYGGFVYESKDKETELLRSSNAEIFEGLIKFQAKHQKSFFFIITLELRDTGKQHYLQQINQTLDQLESLNLNVDALRRWYTSQDKKGAPAYLRQLKFSVPTYLHRLAYQHFQVVSYGAWRYKNYYHTALFFETRKNSGLLGLPQYPPIDELKALLNTSIVYVKDNLGEIETSIISAPALD